MRKSGKNDWNLRKGSKNYTCKFRVAGQKFQFRTSILTTNRFETGCFIMRRQKKIKIQKI